MPVYSDNDVFIVLYVAMSAILIRPVLRNFSWRYSASSDHARAAK